MVTSSSNSKAKAPDSPDMSTNGSSGSSGHGGGLDSPPSYDYATSLPVDLLHGGAEGIGGSSSSGGGASAPPGPSGSAPAGADGRGPPKHIEHLFYPPPNAEQLLGRNSTQLQRVEGITTHKKWLHNVSFDPALQDPDTLYDWIRFQALQIPHVKLKIQGSHMELPGQEITTTDSNGSHIKKSSEYRKVIDFDFFIDLKNILDHPENTANIHLRSVSASNPTFRGTFVKHYGAQYRAPDQSPFPALQTSDAQGYSALPHSGEYTATDVGARARRNDLGYDSVEGGKWLWSKGLPAWTDLRNNQEFWADRAAGWKGKKSGQAYVNIPESWSSFAYVRVRLPNQGQFQDEAPASATVRGWDDEEAAGTTSHDGYTSEQALRAWCRKYCSDPGLLKSFELKKWIWGWETGALETAIRGAILSTGYQSKDISVEWDIGDFEVTVRPPNFLSKLVWDTPGWLMPLVLILYPLIWLWQRMSTEGGGPYHVAKASYSFKFYPALPSTFPNESLEAAQDRLPSLYKLHPELPKSPVLQRGPKGIHYLLGRKEGEWFREWEERIRMGVRMSFKGELHDTRVGEHEVPMLDGY